MILALLILLVASLLASGVLFTHARWLTYLATAGVLLEGQWLLLTLIDRTVALEVVTRTVLLVGAAVLLIIWGKFYKSWTRPKLVWRREIAVLLVMVITLGAAWLVGRANGFNANGDFVTHGFYNGDTATLISLVQRSQLTDGLVQTNPFAGGGVLEYPTLLHAGMATAVSEFGWGMDWLHLLMMATLIQIALLVPIFFLLWDLVTPEPKESWRAWLGVPSRALLSGVQAGLVFYVMALSWDNYIYPQSHFFLTGMFILLVALLLRSWRERAWREYWWVVPASLLTLVLMMANAVTGTAAVAVTVVFYLLRVLDRPRPIGQRAGYLIGVLVWLALFLWLMPGDGAFGWPPFSYTAAEAMVRLAPVLIALVVAAWLNLDRGQLLVPASMVLVAMAFATFFFSTRNIVVENAERFFYHGLLVGFPLLLSPLIQSYYWVRKRILYFTAPLGQMVAGWVGVIGVLLLLALPALASGASAHDHLMFKDEQIVTIKEQEALKWLRENASPEAVVLGKPVSPWSVPMFTGRALVWTDFWLAPDQPPDFDQALRQSDFVLVEEEQFTNLELFGYDIAFSNDEISIHQRGSSD